MNIFITKENLKNILTDFKNRIFDKFYTKSEVDFKLQNVDSSNLLDKATYDKDKDGIIDKSKVAENIEGYIAAPLFSYYGKNKEGKVGFHSFPISTIKDDLNNYTSTILDAKANNIYTIDLRDKKDDQSLICQAYEFVDGKQDVVNIVKSFNNSDRYNFIYDEDKVMFNEGMQIKTNHELKLTKNSDELFESQEINKSEFIELNGLR